MTQFLTEQEVLQKFFPELEVSRVLLETGGTLFLDEKEPHTARVKLNPENRKGNLVITLDLLVSSTTKGDELGSLAKEKKIEECLFYKVVAVAGKFSDGVLVPLSSGAIQTRIIPIIGNKNFRVFSDVLTDGSILFKYFNSVRYELKEEQIDFLAFTFFPFIDKDMFQKNFGVSLNISEDLAGELTQKRNTQIVVLDSRVGPRPQFAKTQDFRQVKRIKEMITDLAELDKTFTNPLLRFDRNQPDTTMARRKANYVSDMKMARDLEENCRFFFALNYKKLLMEKSSFGAYLTKPEFSSYYKYFRINSLKLLRRRVQEVSMINEKTNTPKLDYRPFDHNEVEPVIAKIHEHGPFRMEIKDDKDSSLREINLTLGSAQEQVRFFTGIDKEMKYMSDGLYQYGVEIEVEDNVREVFIQFKENLFNSKLRLEEYLVEASKPGISKMFPEVNNPHIKVDDRESPAKFFASQGNFDPMTNTFTKSFVDSQNSMYLVGAMGVNRSTNSGVAVGASTPTNVVGVVVSPWVHATVNYLKVLSVISNLKIEDKTRLQQFLLSISSPATGSPMGIGVFISLIEDLIQRINDLIGIHEEASLGGTSRSFTGGNAFRNINVRQWFSNVIFNASLEKKSGVDYFASSVFTGEKNTDGLRLILGGEYEQQEEVSFMSPAKVGFGTSDMAIEATPADALPGQEKK